MIKERIETKIEQIIFGYDAHDFMPILVEGKLANKNEFIAYKATSAIKKLVRQ